MTLFAPGKAEKRRPSNRSDEEMAMRALVVPELRRRWPAARIIHELPDRFSSNRIDLAAVTETELIGVEIKSSRDVIHRLEAQLRAFFPVCTRLIVVLAPKWNEALPPKVKHNAKGRETHTPLYTEAQQIIRDVSRSIETWTCDVAGNDGAGMLDAGDRFYHPVFYHRSGAHRPWPEWMLHILHVEELKQIAFSHCIAVGKRPNHEHLVAACCDMMRGPEIVRAVCRALRARKAFCYGTDAPIVEAKGGAG